MANRGPVSTLAEAAKQLGESLELVEELVSNSDNVTYGDLIHVDDGSEEGITCLTEDGIDCVRELLADIRTWPGGIRQFLIDERCEPDMIERVMVDEANR